MDFPDGPEHPLPNGDVTVGVVRVGDTVRRPRGPHSTTVHRVLAHLKSVGFDGAPRFLGVDERDREVLSFVDGEVAGRPWPPWVAARSRVQSVVRLVRSLDTALQPLGIPHSFVSEPVPEEAPPSLSPVPSQLSHRDVTPENVVFRQGVAHALIDFDLVQPSTPVQSVVNLLLWWAAWLDPVDREQAVRDVDPFRFGSLVTDTYGLSEENRSQLVPVAINTAEISWHVMRSRAARLGGGWQRMWNEGVGDSITRRLRWLDRHRGQLATAVGGC